MHLKREYLFCSESVEPKLPLIWSGFLTLTYQHADKDEPYCGSVLRKFCEILLQTSDDKGNSKWGRGLLSVIGLGKQGSLSLSFRFICRALAGVWKSQCWFTLSLRFSLSFRLHIGSTSWNEGGISENPNGS